MEFTFGELEIGAKFYFNGMSWEKLEVEPVRDPVYNIKPLGAPEYYNAYCEETKIKAFIAEHRKVKPRDLSN